MLNKYHQKIQDYSDRLPKLTEKQRQWAFDNVSTKRGLFNGKKVWCLHCGHIFEDNSSELGKQLIKGRCPHCGKELELRPSKKYTFKDSLYFSVITTSHDFQVVRHYIVDRFIRKGEAPKIDINEVVQVWINCKGYKTIVARMIASNFFNYDFCYNTSLRVKPQIKPENRGRYIINPLYTYPRKRILPVIKRNGYKRDIDTIASSELFEAILTNSRAETLLKAGQNSLLTRLICGYNFSLRMEHFWHSVKIAIRNNYIVENASDWFDYLYHLEYLRLDTHNAKYVCPADFIKEHQRYIDKYNKKIESERLKKEAKQAARYEAKYKSQKSKYFGICIVANDMTIAPIKSVREMREEGMRMHHCVFINEYYKNKNSLILSAKNSKGERIETIELDLTDMTVLQSRAKFNGISERHKEILDLINDNKKLFIKAKNSKITY